MSEIVVTDGTSDEGARGTSGTSHCPNCGHSVRYDMCANCRLRLNCGSCKVRLADPLHQRECDVCGTPVDQPVSVRPPQAGWGDSAGQSSAGEPPPRMSRVTALVDGRDGSGEIRRAAAGYAAALLAQNRHAEASDVLEVTLREPGEEPSRAELMLLRAECAQRLGTPGKAVEDLLDAVESDPDCLPDAAPWLRTLMPADGAKPGRVDLLEHWAPRVLQRLAGRQATLVASLELMAAIFEHDQIRAQDAIVRVDDIELSRQVLRETRLRTPVDAHVFATLARLEAGLGLRDDALADINRAIELGLSTDGDPREDIHLLEFKAALLDPDTEREAIADIYLSAGERAYHADQIELAERLLTASIETVERAPTRWYLTDTRRLHSLTIPDHTERLPVLRQVLSEWEAGAVLEPPDWDSTWALDILAYIYRDLSEAEPRLGGDHLLAAAAALERHILLDDRNVGIWSFLALGYISLGLPAAALDAARHAQALDDGHVGVLFATAWAEVHTGDRNFRVSLERILSEPPTPLLRGHALYLLERYEEVGKVLEPAFDDDVDGLNARQLAGYALLHLGRSDEAAAQFEKLARLLQAGDPRSQEFGIVYVADVAYRTGRFQDAITLLGPLLGDFASTSYTVSEVMGTLMLCYLVHGDVRAAGEMMDWIRVSMRNVYDAVELGFDLTALAVGPQLSQAPEAAQTALAFASEMESIAERIREAGSGPAVAVDQLKQIRPRYAAKPLAYRQALDLTMTRLLLKDDRWEEAARRCRDLLKDHPWSWPERSGLVSRLLDAVDALLHAGQLADAESVLASTLDLPGLDEERDLAPINARRALTALLRADRAAAQLAADASRSLPAHTVTDMLRSTISGTAELRRLRQAIRGIEAPHFVIAFDQLRDELFQLNPPVGEWGWPMALPIVLDIAPDLVPPDTGPTGHLFAESIPALRSRIQDATGVTLPGIRVREDPGLSSGTFRVCLGDGWPVSDAVRPGYVFLACSRKYVTSVIGDVAELLTTTDPVTGAEACWVPVPKTELDPVDDGLHGLTQRAFAWIAHQAIRVAGAVKWHLLRAETGASDDPVTYPLRVLEGHLLTNAASLLSVDDTAALIEKWREDGLLEVGEDTPDLAAIVRLTTIFRDLLAQGYRLQPMAESGTTLARIGMDEMAYDAALSACRDLFPKTRASQGCEPESSGT